MLIGMRMEFLSIVEEYCDRLEPFMMELEQQGKWQLESKRKVPNWYLAQPGVVFIFRVLKPGYKQFVSKILDV